MTQPSHELRSDDAGARADATATPRRVVATLFAVSAVVIGVAMIAFASMVGDCGAFGGRCPSEPPPLREDDTFGIAAFGAALASGVPVFVVRPSWRRFAIAIAVAVVAALVVGLAVRSAAAS